MPGVVTKVLAKVGDTIQKVSLKLTVLIRILIILG